MSLAAYFHAKTYVIEVSKTQSSKSYAYERPFSLNKENHGLHEDNDIAEHMIPTIFNEETEFLSNCNLNSLQRHYMTFYWKVREDFLDYIEDSMYHDSLIGSTISTRSKKMFLALIQFLLRVFSHMILRHQKYQRKTTHMTFVLRISIMHFYPNLTLRDIGTMLRRNLKKIRIIQVKNSIRSQTILVPL
jgi:hypothetical protein